MKKVNITASNEAPLFYMHVRLRIIPKKKINITSIIYFINLNLFTIRNFFNINYALMLV